MVNDQILDRLAKLIELQSRPGSVGEAEAVAGRIQSLLTAHQLTMLDAERLLSGKGQASDYAKREVTLERFTTWRQLLLNGVAKQNFCRAVRQYERTSIHKTNGNGWRLGHSFLLVGSVENMATVVQLYEYLESTIDRLGGEYSARLSAANAAAFRQSGFRYNPKGEGIEFRNGAAIGVVAKLWAARNQTIDEAGSGAIVLHEEHKLDEAVESQVGETVKSTKLALGKTDTEGFRAGMAAGFGINTDPQLAGNGRDSGILAVSEGS